MGMMPPGSGAGGYPPHWTPSALGSPSGGHPGGPPAPIGNSPSFGRRWASNNFGQGPPQAAPPYPAPGTAGGPAFSIPPAGGDAQGGIVDALDAFARQQQQQGSGASSPQRGGAGAPWEGGAAGPAGTGASGFGGGAGTWPPQGAPELPPAGAPSGMQPPGSRGAYSYRPPWATDEAAGPSGGSASGGVDAGPGAGPGAAGYAGFNSPPPPMRTPSKDRFGMGPGNGGPAPVQRSPMHSILGGGGGYDAVAGGRSGAAQTRALQQQLLSMQAGDGAVAAAAAGGPVLGGGYGGGGGHPGSYQQQQQHAPPSLYSGAPPAHGAGQGGDEDGGRLPGMMGHGSLALGMLGAAPSGRHGAGSGGHAGGPGGGPPGGTSAGTPPAAGGHSAAKLMAVKQRSGAGAADCLVW